MGSYLTITVLNYIQRFTRAIVSPGISLGNSIQWIHQVEANPTYGSKLAKSGEIKEKLHDTYRSE